MSWNASKFSKNLDTWRSKSRDKPKNVQTFSSISSKVGKKSALGSTWIASTYVLGLFIYGPYDSTVSFSQTALILAKNWVQKLLNIWEIVGFKCGASNWYENKGKFKSSYCKPIFPLLLKTSGIEICFQKSLFEITARDCKHTA